MDAPVIHEEHGRVILYSKADPSKRDVLYLLASLFEDMGGDKEVELAKLEVDETYFNYWAKDLPCWCPQVAYYLEKDSV